MVRLFVLFFAVLASSTSCGGTLAPPDSGTGAGGSAGTVFPPPTGSGGDVPADAGGGNGGAPGDAGGGARDCEKRLVATPVAGAACRYEIPAPPCSAVDRGRIGVFVDDIQIPRAATGETGWDYSDADFTTIEIHGASCDALLNGSAATVTVFFYIILI